MSWETKQDYCCLAIDTDGVNGQGADHSLPVKSATEGRQCQYLEKHGKNGDYKATKVFGDRASPSNAYTVAGEVEITGKALGTVNTVDGKKYALESVKWSTGADAEPTFEATAQQVADSAQTRNTFKLPDFKLSSDHVAQIPEFKWTEQGEYVPAFSLPAGTAQAAKNVGVELTKCDGEASCSVKTNDKNGSPQAHDVTNGHIVLQITIGQYGEQKPELSPGDGWDVSGALTCDDPDSDMPTWTATLTHPLEKTMAEQ